MQFLYQCSPLPKTSFIYEVGSVGQDCVSEGVDGRAYALDHLHREVMEDCEDLAQQIEFSNVMEKSAAEQLQYFTDNPDKREAFMNFLTAPNDVADFLEVMRNWRSVDDTAFSHLFNKASDKHSAWNTFETYGNQMVESQLNLAYILPDSIEYLRVEGEIVYRGHDLTGNLAFVQAGYQDGVLYDSQNIKTRGMSMRVDASTDFTILEKSDLKDKWDDSITLSRAFVASSIAANPNVILMDSIEMQMTLQQQLEVRQKIAEFSQKDNSVDPETFWDPTVRSALANSDNAAVENVFRKIEDQINGPENPEAPVFSPSEVMTLSSEDLAQFADANGDVIFQMGDQYKSFVLNIGKDTVRPCGADLGYWETPRDKVGVAQIKNALYRSLDTGSDVTATKQIQRAGADGMNRFLNSYLDVRSEQSLSNEELENWTNLGTQLRHKGKGIHDVLEALQATKQDGTVAGHDSSVHAGLNRLLKQSNWPLGQPGLFLDDLLPIDS